MLQRWELTWQRTYSGLTACDARGKAVVSESLTRRQLSIFMAQLPPCLVGMEACPTSNYWTRELQKFGHQVRLMAPRFVRAYVKANWSYPDSVDGVGLA